MLISWMGTICQHSVVLRPPSQPFQLCLYAKLSQHYKLQIKSQYLHAEFRPYHRIMLGQVLCLLCYVFPDLSLSFVHDLICNIPTLNVFKKKKKQLDH